MMVASAVAPFMFKFLGEQKEALAVYSVMRFNPFLILPLEVDFLPPLSCVARFFFSSMAYTFLMSKIL